MPKRRVIIRKKRRARTRREPTSNLSNSNKSIIVIDQRSRRTSRRKGTPVSKRNTVLVGNRSGNDGTGSLDARTAKDVLSSMKTLVDSGLLHHNTLLEKALRRNSELLQTSINKPSFKTPTGEESFSADGSLTPATKTLLGVEAMRNYLKGHLDEIPKAKKYKDADIEKLQANQLLHLYEVTKRDVDSGGDLFMETPDTEQAPKKYSTIEKLKGMLSAAEDKYDEMTSGSPRGSPGGGASPKTLF